MIREIHHVLDEQDLTRALASFVLHREGIIYDGEIESKITIGATSIVDNKATITDLRIVLTLNTDFIVP